MKARKGAKKVPTVHSARNATEAELCMNEVVFVELSRGRRAMIDAADRQAVSIYKWTYLTVGYAAHAKAGMMHRFLMQPAAGFEVDHVNGDRLDNRRSNLRLVTRGQNCQNLHVPRSKTGTGILNVYWHKKRKRFEVQIKADGRRQHLGYFQDIEEASTVAKEARKRLLPFSVEAKHEA